MVKRITAIVNKQGVSKVCVLFFLCSEKGHEQLKHPVDARMKLQVRIHSQYASLTVMLYPIFPSTISNTKGFVTF